MRHLKNFVKPMEVKLRSKMSHWPKIPHRYESSLIQFDRFWSILIDFDRFLSILTNFDRFWSILINFGQIWSNLIQKKLILFILRLWPTWSGWAKTPLLHLKTPSWKMKCPNPWVLSKTRPTYWKRLATRWNPIRILKLDGTDLFRAQGEFYKVQRKYYSSYYRYEKTHFKCHACFLITTRFHGKKSSVMRVQTVSSSSRLLPFPLNISSRARKNFVIFSREIEVGWSESDGTSNYLYEFCNEQRMR